MNDTIKKVFQMGVTMRKIHKLEKNNWQSLHKYVYNFKFNKIDIFQLVIHTCTLAAGFVFDDFPWYYDGPCPSENPTKGVWVEEVL